MNRKIRNTIFKTLKWAIVLHIIMGMLFVQPVQAAGTIIRVKPGGVDSGACGDMWENACSLQNALVQAGTGDEIWATAGMYRPTATSDRTISFALKNGVGIYGGFAGTESDLSQRDPTANVTTLSGDIGIPGDNSDNSYHVVYAYNLSVSTIMDGLTIQGGNANGVKPYDRGGGIYGYLSNISITNVIFLNNTTSNLGGGMFNQSGSPVITDVTFSGNSAAYGGGLYDYDSSPSLTSTTFINNIAQQRGGGMYNNAGNLVLNDVAFSSNSAQVLGGGMSNYMSDLSLTNVAFTNNTAGTSGGGMYNGGGTISLTEVTFTGNSATGGGGMLNSTDSMVTLQNVTFSDNFALERGGGMYNYSSNPTVTDVTFTGNTALIYGGGMFNSGSDPVLTNVTFSYNTSEYDGGGMDNNSSSPTLIHVVFSNNNALNSGGGLHNWEYSSPTLTDVSFVNNSASYRGGGMYNVDYCDFTLSHVTFDGNTAQDYGGGMFLSNSNPSLNQVEFIDNSSPKNGGGLYNSFTDISLTDVWFSGNTAGVFGGGMVNNNSDANLTNVTFSDNSAQERGGGLFNYESAPILTNVTFTENSVLQFGGGMFDSGGSPRLLNTTFFSNHAGVFGGGMAFSFSNATIHNSIYWGNTAVSDGSQIYTFQAGMPLLYDSILEDGCPTGGVCTNVLTADPLLGTLNEHGGFTQTISLQPFSAAIDAGNDATCSVTDQRGTPRPQGSHCDIGAYELQDMDAPETSIDNKNPSTNPTNMDSMVFHFSGMDLESGVMAFECNLDFGEFETCTSPRSYADLQGGEHTFQVRSVDLFGNVDLTPAMYSWTIDLTAPTAMIEVADSALKLGEITTVQITFSEAILFFTNSDLEIENSTLSEITTSDGGVTWIATLTPAPGITDITNQIVLDNSSIQDLAGNPGTGITISNNYAIDTEPPNVTVDQAAEQPDPTHGIPIYFTVTFSESVTGFDNSDVSFIGSTTPGSLIASLSGSGPVYTVAVTGMTNSGVVVVTVPASGVIDVNGNLNVASSSIDNSVAYAPTFADVPFDHPLYAYIQAIYDAGYTSGCGINPLRYCPDLSMTRAESAVFMLRGNFGNSYVPPAAPWGTFADDWSVGTWAEKWAEGMWDEGMTAGCSTNPLKFCPWDLFTREQAAVFGLRMKYGITYAPPAASGTIFADMTNPAYWATKWAEKAYSDGILPACGIQGGKPLFCPYDLVTRGWGAYMIVQAKGLPINP